MVLQLEPSQFASISIEPRQEMSSAEFFEFCQRNRELHIERQSNGEVTIMAPAGGFTGSKNSSLNALLYAWANQDGTGVVFDSSTGFDLPDGSMRSPDVAWVTRQRLALLSQTQKIGFLPLAPDFVIELRSVTDRLAPLQGKMQQYIDNGVRLGWLIDPDQRTVWVYQSGQKPAMLVDPATLSGEPVLPSFTLNVKAIFDPDW